MRNFIALLFLLCSSNATALSCFVPPLEERYRQHRHVVLVEVTGGRLEESDGSSRRSPFDSDSIENVPERTRRVRELPRIVATIRVLESYKGESPPTRLVLTTWGGQPEVTVGARYLVFLNGPEVSLDCDGLRLVSDTDPEDARVIAELKALRGRMQLAEAPAAPSPALTEAECLARSGTWGVHGETEVLAPFCALPTTDGGKSCTDSSQCQGHCLAPEQARRGRRTTGVCTATDHAGACFNLIQEGRASGRICT
jgi:hypothetical protein